MPVAFPGGRVRLSVACANTVRCCWGASLNGGWPAVRAARTGTIPMRSRTACTWSTSSIRRRTGSSAVVSSQSHTRTSSKSSSATNQQVVTDKTHEAITVRASWFNKPSHWRARHRDVATVAELAIEFNVADSGWRRGPAPG